MTYSTQGFSTTKRQKVWRKTEGKCWYCGIQTVMTPQVPLAKLDSYSDQFCIDHVQSWGAAGTHNNTNLVPACKSCNSTKGTKGLEAYRVWLAQQGLPVFTADHIAYMQQLGIQLPAGFPCYPIITFWFEREGLQP